MNVSLPESMRRFIEEEVAAGGYSTVSEYIRALVREEQKLKAQERLEALVLEGLESGEPTEMTKEHWEDIRRKALARRKTRSPA